MEIKTLYKQSIKINLGIDFRIFAVLFLLHFLNYSNVSAQDCSPQSPSFIVDLSDDPSGFWQSTDPFTPSGPCCGVPSSTNCFTLTIFLHEDANGVMINFSQLSGSTGTLTYFVDCLQYGTVGSSMAVPLCFDGPGPHIVTFCRQGIASYAMSVSSQSYEFDISLPPFEDKCTNDTWFLFNTGYPSGGSYYVNGTMAFFFDPAFYGQGEHEITYVYSHSGSQCAGSATQTITVHPVPEISFPAMTYCFEEALIPLHGANPPGGEYWGNYVVEGVFNAGLSGPGTFDIFYGYTNPGGCYSQLKSTITILDLPAADAGPDNIIPQGTTAPLHAQNPDIINFTYHWSPVDLVAGVNNHLTNTVALTESALFTLTVTNNALQCQNTDTKVVYVSGGPLSLVKLSASSPSICHGSSTQLLALPTGGSGNYSFHWTANPPLTNYFPPNIPDPVVTPDVTTTFTIVITDNSNGSTITGNIIVNVEQPLAVTLTLPASQVCGNDEIFLLSGGYPQGGYYSVPTLNQYNISSLNPSMLPAGQHLITYTIISQTGCPSEASQYLTVLPKVKAVFYPQQDFCQSNEVNFINLSQNASTFNWYIGQDYHPDMPYDPFIHIFDIPYLYEEVEVTLVASHMGCFHSYTQSVLITAPTIANFYVEEELTGCAPHHVNFINNTAGPATLYLWDFGNGNFSVDENPHVIYQNFTDQSLSYEVVLTAVAANFMCSSQHSITITVHPLIEAGFGFEDPASCHPYEVEIFNIATGVHQYHWDMGDNSDALDTSEPFFTHLYENFTESAQTYTITQTVTSQQGCQDMMTQQLTVYPYQESGFTANITEGCAPLTVNFQDASKGAVTNWTYIFMDGATSDNPNPTYTFQNKTNGTIVYQVMQITDNGHFCIDSTFLEITVHPELKAEFDFSPYFICSPVEVMFTNTSSGHIENMFWDMGDGNTFPSSETTIFHGYQNQGNLAEVFHISLTVENSNCSHSKTLQIEVFPEVAASFYVSEISGCQPLEVSFTNESENASSFFWEFGDNNTSEEEHPDHIYQNIDFEELHVYTVNLFAVSQYLCFDFFETEITVYPNIKAFFTVDEVAGCSPLEVTISHNSVGAANFLWDFGNGDQSDENSETIKLFYDNTDVELLTYDIVLQVYNDWGCPDLMLRQITVYPEVSAEFNATTEGCHPLKVNFENLSENAHIFQWDFGLAGSSTSHSPTHVFNNYSNTEQLDYPVELWISSMYGCKDSTYSSITVNPRPAANFTVENSPGCAPYEVFFNNFTLGATEFFWDFGNDNYSDLDDPTLSVTYHLPPGSDPAVYSVFLEVGNEYGCIDTISNNVIIYPSVLADFSASITEGCHPLIVNFSNFSLGANAYTPYLWDYGDGHSSAETSEDHLHTFNNFSNTGIAEFTVTLIAMNENHCADTLEIDIRVNPLPLPSFTSPNPAGCSPHDATLQNLSVGATQFLWNFGDGTFSETDSLEFFHTFTQPPGTTAGHFNVSLTAWNQYNCVNQIQHTIVAYPLVISAFESPESGCTPRIINFQNQSQGALNSVWNFGEGNFSNALNPTHGFFNDSYTEVMDFVITLTSTNNFGCQDVFTDTLFVFPEPLVNFDLSSRSGCAPFAPSIFNFSQGANSFFWDFANATSDTSELIFTHLWDNISQQPVNYAIYLSGSNSYGCSSSNTQIINVFPRVTAAFTTDGDIFQGCSPLSLQFKNQSQLAFYYHWDFGDEEQTTLSDPAHVFVNLDPNLQTFPVRLVAQSIYNCRDTLIRDINVYPTPVAEFLPSPWLQTYPSTTVMLENLCDEAAIEFDWDFDDGNYFNTQNRETFNHTYIWDPGQMETKIYRIRLTASNEICSTTVIRNITITSPVPEASFVSQTQGCSPLEVQFYNTSIHAHSFYWDFGNGFIALEENPRHIFFDPGIYNVMLIAIGDGGRDTTFRNITVFESPIAKFELINSLIDIPHQPLQVRNLSYNAHYYLWDFGDGSQSAEYEPEHYYQHPGYYSITLIASTDTSPQCHDTLTLYNGLYAQQSCRVVFPNAFKPDNAGSSGGYYNVNEPSTTVFHPLHEGLLEYNLEIYTRWGELIFRSNNPEIGWDGYIRGQLSKMDVYVWRFSGRCENGKKINKTGDVTLLR
jgi:PKD repeat protein